MARPTKFNEDRAKRILEALRAGATRKASAEAAGITYDCFLDWIARGKKSKDEDLLHFFHAVTHAEADCEIRNTAILAKAANGWEAGTVTRTTKTVFKVRKTRKPDGSVVEEPIALEEVTEQTTSAREFDWRASLEWLKRRRRADWGDSIDVRKLDDETILRLLALEAGGAETRLITE